MSITQHLTDPAVLADLGRRVKGHRLEARLTQAELAEQAGVGKRTLERLEAGNGTELLTLVRVLRVLERLDGFEQLLPEIGPGPIVRLKAKGKTPQRVMHPRDRQAPGEASESKVSDKAGAWTWGED